VKVGLINTEIGGGVGGRFTFQQMLLDATEGLRGQTRHEFVVYHAGISRYSEGSAAWRVRRTTSVAATLAVRVSHDMQDHLVGKRLVHLRTPLQRQLDSDGVDLVWFPTTYAEDVDQPYVCTVFDLEHRMKPWFPEVSAGGEFERRERFFNRYLPKATRVIVPNETGREQVVRFYRVETENCLTLSHPTPDFALKAAAQPRSDARILARLGLPERFLFYPAQFWPHKNHAALLDALAELRARGSELALVCVGSDKGAAEHVRAQARERGLEDHAHVMGFVPDDVLVALYQHAHALVYLSRFGPENLPPLEGFALGCPVVAADVPGAQAQLGDAALIVDPTDPGQVTDAVERAADPDERERLVTAGVARAESWTAKDYVRGLTAFLDDFESERRLWA
jgi:glycosyltransferase involved in cell wall biosynthesis